MQEEKERYGHHQTQTHRKEGQKIKLHSSAFKGREKRRSDLQANEKDKKDKSEITQKVKNGTVDGDAGVTHTQSNEENECDAKRNTEDFDVSQGHTECNHHGIHQQNMTDRIGIRQKLH